MRVIHVGVSGFIDLGRGSPEYALPASLGFGRSCGCTDGPDFLSGLLVLVTVSRVVMLTLSVRRSSTPPLVLCELDVVLL